MREKLTPSERERPSRHGRILGETLAAIVDLGRRAAPDQQAEMCATCAFRSGSMPNQMASTGLHALKTTIGVDPDDFACHHGMKDGWPTKLCAGYLIAKKAPFAEVRAEMERIQSRLSAATGPDEVRAAFDAWLDEVDPHRALDDYQLGRLFAKDAGRAALASAAQSRTEGEENG